jgi:hypothetical protein
MGNDRIVDNNSTVANPLPADWHKALQVPVEHRVNVNEYVKVDLEDDIIEKLRKFDSTVIEIRRELLSAYHKHGSADFASAHEGYAVLLEEVDELWYEVKRNAGKTPRAYEEAIQVAAMAIKYIISFDKNKNVPYEPKPMTEMERLTRLYEKGGK